MCGDAAQRHIADDPEPAPYVAACGPLLLYRRRCKISASDFCASPFCLTSYILADRFRGSGGNTRMWFRCIDFGGVAQLGERVNGIHEVRGSIPLASIPDLGCGEREASRT
jgi:hypothetical protein